MTTPKKFADLAAGFYPASVLSESKRCPGCRRVYTEDDLLSCLRPEAFADLPEDPEALDLCPECEERELYPGLAAEMAELERSEYGC